jgi:hypothetical protein
VSEYPLGFAVRALKQGLSARAGLSAYRSGGGRIADATWFRMYSEARESTLAQISELGRPLNRKPTGDEINTFTTKSATGYMQYVDIYVRDKETGLVSVRPYSLRSDRLYSRGKVVNDSLTAYSDAAEAYGEQVLGAAYMSTYELVPGGE